MKGFFLILSLCLSFPAWAADEGEPRFTVVVSMEGKDFLTGRKITIPPNRGYKFSIVGAGTLRPYMRVYDSTGLEVQAFFPMPSLVQAMTPEEKAEWEKKKKEKEKERELAAANELKEDISSGLEATITGAVVAKEGCCDVDDKKTEEPQGKPVEAAVEDTPAEPAAAELEIESPPEDFVDVSPGFEEEPEMQAAEAPEVAEEAAPAEEKKAEVKVVELDSSILNPEYAPIPAMKPEDKKRSPALQRPEPESYVQLPERGPIPKFRPDSLERASSPRTRDMRGEEAAEEKQPEKEDNTPRRPASSSYLCRAFDAFKGKGVPEKPLRQALMFLEKNKAKFKDQRYLSIADYSQSSTKKRFYLLDLKTFGVLREKVSHGGGRKNSGDPNHDGMLNACGGSGSERTRGGFFTVGDYYFSQKGRYKWPMLTRKPPRNGMKLVGLTPGVNTSVYNDGYVMHEAKYNSNGGAVMGRSDGCPAFVPGKGAPILAKLRGGSLQYHYTPMCKDHQSRALRQVSGWESFCK
jgi:hypothetical protein